MSCSDSTRTPTASAKRGAERLNETFLRSALRGLAERLRETRMDFVEGEPAGDHCGDPARLVATDATIIGEHDELVPRVVSVNVVVFVLAL